MNLRTKTMIATGAVALGSAGAFGISAANAASTHSTSLAAAIASKFGLKVSDVQAVIDSQHQAQLAERQAKFTAKLDAAVKAGTITADQKAKILAKMQELEAARTSLKSMTPAERQAAMAKQRTDLATWAKDNNIPTSLLHAMHGGHRMHAHSDTETNDDAPTSPSPSPAATTVN